MQSLDKTLKRDCTLCPKASEPDLFPDNVVAFQLFNILRGQYITAGMDGTILGLDYPAVFGVLDIYEVLDRKDVFEKIIYLAQMDINSIREKIKKNTPKK